MLATAPSVMPSRVFARRRRSRGSGEQRTLFCGCGNSLPRRAGRCRACSRAAWRSRRRFGSNREAVLERDGYQCRGCGAGNSRLHVHHRRPGCHLAEFLVALCAACHARVHRLRANRVWLSTSVFEFWTELHPGYAVQLQFPAEVAR